MTLSVIESDAFQQMEKVAELHLQGHSPYTIARRLGVKVIEAKAAITQWQTIVANDLDSRDAARDYLNDMVKRYDNLLVAANENLALLNGLEYGEKISAQINTTIKTIADLDAKRVDLLQKAGLYDAGDIGDQIAEAERREEIIKNILRNHLCEHCTPVVKEKLRALNNSNAVDGEVVE